MKKETKTVDTKKAVAEVKEAVAEAKKTVAQSAPAKKAAAVAAEVKKAAPTKKAPAKRAAKPAAKPAVKAVLQYAGKEVSCEQMVEAAKAAWHGEEIKDLALYIKPEENRVYFVVNGEGTGSFEL